MEEKKPENELDAYTLPPVADAERTAEIVASRQAKRRERLGERAYDAEQSALEERTDRRESALSGADLESNARRQELAKARQAEIGGIEAFEQTTEKQAEGTTTIKTDDQKAADDTTKSDSGETKDSDSKEPEKTEEQRKPPIPPPSGAPGS